MNLVANAIMIHNVVDMTDIIENLVVEGIPVTQKHIALHRPSNQPILTSSFEKHI